MSASPTDQPSVDQPASVTITFFRNGDQHFAGLKYVINRRIRNFEYFLMDLTTKLNPQFGAIMRVYWVGPTHYELVDELLNFKHGENYVAVGKDRLKKMQYLNISEPADFRSTFPNKKTRLKSARSEPLHMRAAGPGARRRYLRSAQFRKRPTDGSCILVYRNGDQHRPPTRVLLRPADRTSLSAVMKCVDEKVKLNNGPILRLWTTDGMMVKEVDQIEPGNGYVGVGREKTFKAIDYESIESPRWSGFAHIFYRQLNVWSRQRNQLRPSSKLAWARGRRLTRLVVPVNKKVPAGVLRPGRVTIATDNRRKRLAESQPALPNPARKPQRPRDKSLTPHEPASPRRPQRAAEGAARPPRMAQDPFKAAEADESPRFAREKTYQRENTVNRPVIIEEEEEDSASEAARRKEEEDARRKEEEDARRQEEEYARRKDAEEARKVAMDKKVGEQVSPRKIPSSLSQRGVSQPHSMVYAG